MSFVGMFDVCDTVAVLGIWDNLLLGFLKSGPTIFLALLGVTSDPYTHAAAISPQRMAP